MTSNPNAASEETIRYVAENLILSNPTPPPGEDAAAMLGWARSDQQTFWCSVLSPTTLFRQTCSKRSSLDTGEGAR